MSFCLLCRRAGPSLRTSTGTLFLTPPVRTTPTIRHVSRFNFDTYKLVRQLERQGFSRGQSVAIMRTINALLVDSTLSVRGQMLAKTETESRDIGTSTDLKIQEIHHRLVIQVSSLKTKMETIKMDLTRNIVWTALLAFAFILSVEFITQPSLQPKSSSGLSQANNQPS
ncbi:hypothetical protein BC829DRAFT_379511 [Chytridium lagenaria]|nr:hypothetical protein BC829DRAFT_379511 [Chytridium lagenaria]